MAMHLHDVVAALAARHEVLVLGLVAAAFALEHLTSFAKAPQVPLEVSGLHGRSSSSFSDQE